MANGTMARRRLELEPGTGAAGSGPSHIPLGPLAVFDGTLAEATEFALAAIRRRSGVRIATANLDFVARARRDATLREDLAGADLVTADGAPVAWLARAAGGRSVERVTGVDLVAEVCRRGAAEGLRVAMYGSQPATAMVAARVLEDQYPGLRVVSVICPPFREQTESEVAAELAELAAADPQFVLVALGCPRQERFIARFAHVLPGAAWIGVGGTFDFFAGKRARAPRIAQRLGGEWLVRLGQEPRRLWRRYLVEDLPALVLVAPGCIRRRLRGSAA